MAHVLMVAAENGALPGGKVGGIGDVLRETPPALAQRNCEVSVVTPAYGVFHELAGASKVETIKTGFAGATRSLDLYRIDGVSGRKRVRHYVIEHPLFSQCGSGRIYCDDPPGRPFETDASKFALFCAAVAEAIESNAFGTLDALHLHDWHAALLLVLRRYDPSYRKLRALRTVYSIHNLAIQGIRPFSGQESSLEQWYPSLKYQRGEVADPKWTDCVNPMASAIRLADAVHTVSPSYAEEILQPSDPAHGYHGGEGLEADLRAARQQNRLFGILNGCEYPGTTTGAVEDWPALLQLMREQLPLWIAREAALASAHYLAQRALDRLDDTRPRMLITSVGRVTEQKIGLLRQPTSQGIPALHAVLETLGEDGMLLMQGSGDPESERFLSEASVRHPNLIFLRGYSDALANSLYRQGDLFLMPSSFEPCGISQMLALRAGQPCLVHHVGGLRDTIEEGKTGFAFDGDNPTAQADALLAALKRALKRFSGKSGQWQRLRKTAAAARFTWDKSVDAYIGQLYRIS